ncbi:MAG TPA: TPM domain-containing protein, partial [Candidatus Limnocylindria bacterium]|nr:TPM domain-containing protein [Candidatus Limnocylindria bacterium]
MRHASILIGFLFLALAIPCGPARAQATPVPERTGWAIDQTGVLQAATLARLDHDLSDYARRTGREVVVVLVPTTGEESNDAYGERLIDAWELGGPAREAAALVWAADGYIGIGVGAGAAHVLTPTVRERIQADWIVPRFGEGDADAGIVAGAEQIMQVLDGQPIAAIEVPSGIAIPDDTNLALPVEARDPSPGWAMAEGFAVEIARMVDGFSRNGGSTWRVVLAEARQQWAGLDGALSQAWQGRAPGGELARGAVIVLGGLALLAFVAVSKGRLRTGAFLLGVAGAPALWVATGATALGVVTLVLSIAFVLLWPIAKPVLKAIATRDDGDADAEDERRKREAILAATSKKPPLVRT